MLQATANGHIITSEEYVLVANDTPELPVTARALKDLREGSRLSLRDMARELKKDGYDIHFTELGRIEGGTKELREGLLVAYCATLNRIWEEDGVRLGRLVKPGDKQTR